MAKQNKKTNPGLVTLIGDLKAQTRSNGAALWRDVAHRLEKSRSNWAEPNLARQSNGGHSKITKIIIQKHPKMESDHGQFQKLPSSGLPDTRKYMNFSKFEMSVFFKFCHLLSPPNILIPIRIERIIPYTQYELNFGFS